MSYNLIHQPWIPIHRHDGREEWIRPWEITDHLQDATSPVAGLRAPRPDFNGALIQFLVGLVQTAFVPETEREWRKRLQQPPGPAKLQSAFEEHASAFELGGDVPRFLQDHDTIPEAKNKPIAYLLVDSPSDNALRKNTDHFVKDRTAEQYGPACTAAALYALQTNAPQGGRGHRTSLRGGGPVSTLVLGRNLWHTIWLNVLPRSAVERGGIANADAEVTVGADVYPWMAATRVSDDDTATTPDDVHPLQAFWGMPRRIYLEDPDPKGGRCSLCGRQRDRVFTGYRTTSHGVKYAGAWEHPLTPHRRTDDGELRPYHGQQEGFSYRHWRGFAASGEDGSTQPARVVSTFHDRSKYAALDRVFEGRPRLWVFGFEADRTKIRAWHESRMPLYPVSEAVRRPLETLAAQLVQAAQKVAGNLTQALRRALYGYPTMTSTGQTTWDIDKKASRDHTFFENAEVQFWQDTEPSFYVTLDRGIGAIEAETSLEVLKHDWIGHLRETALDLFDDTTQYGHFRAADPKALAVARQELSRYSSRRTSTIREALDLPRPASAEA
jgi:CRISPR system Cascade subunit CasA